MSSHSHSPERGLPFDQQEPDGPTGISAIVPPFAMLIVILAIVALVVLFHAIWATAIAAFATACMAAYVMVWMDHLTR
ncbi:MAG: hypothetical protein ABSG93_17830 [Solirubrobacteraceae bacterium]|jgi:hypothetical protein